MSTFQFQEQLAAYLPPMRAFALSLTKNGEDANDLLQETAFRALRNRDKFRPDTNLKAWLVTIMRNTFINNLRAAKRRKVLSDWSNNSYLIDSDVRQSTSNQGESTVFGKELQQIIDGLKEKYRKPFLMHYQGFAYDEIAKDMDLPLGTIKSRIFVARQQLKKSIEIKYHARSMQELMN
ncbi:MAG: RNA polymerase sigma factor [Bacteroidota bacterium]